MKISGQEYSTEVSLVDFDEAYPGTEVLTPNEGGEGLAEFEDAEFPAVCTVVQRMNYKTGQMESVIVDATNEFHSPDPIVVQEGTEEFC